MIPATCVSATNWFYNCKNLILYNGISLFNLKGITGTKWLIDCEIYNSAGVKLATLNNGEIISGNAQPISIVSTTEEFILKLSKSPVELIHLKRFYNEKYKHCAINVWLQYYLSDGNLIQCTPEISNIPSLQMMKESLFRNSNAAIIMD